MATEPVLSGFYVWDGTEPNDLTKCGGTRYELFDMTPSGLGVESAEGEERPVLECDTWAAIFISLILKVAAWQTAFLCLESLISP